MSRMTWSLLELVGEAAPPPMALAAKPLRLCNHQIRSFTDYYTSECSHLTEANRGIK